MMKDFTKGNNRGLLSSKVILGLVVVVGLVYGATYLHKGIETATAAAFICSFSIAASAWLTHHGHILIMRAYLIWLEAIEKRLDLNRDRLNELVPTSITSAAPHTRRKPFVVYLVKGSFALTPTVLSAATTFSLLTVLWAQLDHPGTRVIIMLAFSSIAVGSLIAGQCLYLAYLHGRVVLLGRQLEWKAGTAQNREEALAPEARRIDLFGDGIALSTRVGRLLVGGRLGSVG